MKAKAKRSQGDAIVEQSALGPGMFQRGLRPQPKTERSTNRTNSTNEGILIEHSCDSWIFERPPMSRTQFRLRSLRP